MAGKKTALVERTWSVVAGRAITLDETSSDGKPRSWLMMLPQGTYHDPRYGEIRVTPALLGELKRNFDDHARRIDIALDVDHDAREATGWIEQVESRAAGSDGNPETPAGLWGLVRWTPKGAQLLKDEIYRYFSIEFGPMMDPVTGHKIENVILGGGLTNRPVMKTMPAVRLSQRAARGASQRTATANGMSAARHLGPVARETPSGRQGGVGTMGKQQGKQPKPTLAEELGLLGESEELNEQDGETLELDEGGEMDEGSEDEGEDDAFDPDEDEHGPMTTDGHTHGKYAEHSHDGDGNHSEAEVKPAKGKKMSSRTKASEAEKSHRHEHPHMPAAEQRGMRESSDVRALREQMEAQTRELAEMRYALYEGEVEKTIDGWRSRTFQFREGPKSGAKTGKIALTKVFAERYRSFMLKGAGLRLAETDRRALNELIESGLSSAIVDLSQRGTSFDQEARRTKTLGEATMGPADSDRLEETAQRIVRERGKSFAEMSEAEVFNIYRQAEEELSK